jgi:isocitrate/isopropylmalate dehydrogenase
MVLWDEIATEVANDFPDVKWDKMLVDAMTCRMVLDPKSLDTIVATNLVGHQEYIHPPKKPMTDLYSMLISSLISPRH